MQNEVDEIDKFLTQLWETMPTPQWIGIVAKSRKDAIRKFRQIALRLTKRPLDASL